MTPDELLIIDCSADVCSCVLCPKLLSVPCLVLLAPLASRRSNLRPLTATPQTCARAPPCYAPMPLMLRFIESDFRVRSWSRKPREIDPPPPVGRGGQSPPQPSLARSEEHTSELQSLMRISYAVFCLKKKKTTK